MDSLSMILLALSVAFSSGRNILSKSISGAPFGTVRFFQAQTVTFLCGGLALLLAGGISLRTAAPITVIYALIYGCLLVSAQWCYTAALKDGNTAVCSTVYSLGFIIPTLSGALFWQEELTGINMLGVLCVIPAVIISGLKGKKELQTDSGLKGKKGTHAGSERRGSKEAQDKNAAAGSSYIIPLLIAMLSSGGLGLMQKVQQSCTYADQKSTFVWLAFVFACLASFAGSLMSKYGRLRTVREEKAVSPGKRQLLLSGGVGLCFGCSNLLNTTLAGRLDSAVFFPMNNISVILVSMILGLLLFKEKIGKKELAVLGLGIVSILLLKG